MIRYLVYTNLFISICAVALTSYCHLILFRKSAGSDLIGFVFFSTLFAYNFHRKVGRTNRSSLRESTRGKWLENHKNLISVLIFISFSFASYFCYQLSKEVLILIFPLALLSVFYVIELNKLPSLRSLPFLKIFIISFVWGGVSVLIPLVSKSSINVTLEWQNHLFALAIALFVFGETIPFDIRDIKEDSFDGLKTLPRKIGIRKSKWLILFLYLCSFCLMTLLSIVEKWDNLILISFGLAVLYSMFWVGFLKENTIELYYSLGIESTLCMPLFIYSVISLF